MLARMRTLRFCFLLTASHQLICFIYLRCRWMRNLKRSRLVPFSSRGGQSKGGLGGGWSFWASRPVFGRVFHYFFFLPSWLKAQRIARRKHTPLLAAGALLLLLLSPCPLGGGERRGGPLLLLVVRPLCGGVEGDGGSLASSIIQAP